MAQICFILIGGCCEEICSGGKSCRQFGKYICLCEKGKTGKNCKENGTLFLFPSVLSYVRINKKWVQKDFLLDVVIFVTSVLHSTLAMQMLSNWFYILTPVRSAYLFMYVWQKLETVKRNCTDLKLVRRLISMICRGLLMSYLYYFDSPSLSKKGVSTKHWLPASWPLADPLKIQRGNKI